MTWGIQQKINFFPRFFFYLFNYYFYVLLLFNIFQETCSAAPSCVLITFIHLQTCILFSTRNSILNCMLTEHRWWLDHQQRKQILLIAVGSSRFRRSWIVSSLNSIGGSLQEQRHWYGWLTAPSLGSWRWLQSSSCCHPQQRWHIDCQVALNQGNCSVVTWWYKPLHVWPNSVGFTCSFGLMTVTDPVSKT